MSIDLEESIKEQARQIMSSNSVPYSQEDVDDAIKVILSIAMEEIDFMLAEGLCEKFIKSKNETLKMIAIESVAHIARVYHRQVNSNIMEAIYGIYKDPTHQHWGTADLTLDELELFLKISRPCISSKTA